MYIDEDSANSTEGMSEDMVGLGQKRYGQIWPSCEDIGSLETENQGGTG